MVYLNRIYTKTGDDGRTSLGDGSRVPKTDPRIAAYGSVDELNCVLGVALTAVDDPALSRVLQTIQNDLFDVGADLCVPEARTEQTGADPDAAQPLRVTAEKVTRLEREIDGVNARLEPLSSFVLPGGSRPAAYLHHARAVCRRAEIAVLHLAARDRINPYAAIYLNRLSDLLFVLARAANNDGADDVLWVPGGPTHADGSDRVSGRGE